MATAWGWRAAFLLEAAAMTPLAALFLLGPPVDIRRSGGSGAAGGLCWEAAG